MSERYTLILSEDADAALDELPKVVRERMIKRLEWLAEHAVETNHEAMTGNWGGYYRIRSGDYRAIYALDAEGRQIIIEKIGHRKDVY